MSEKIEHPGMIKNQLLVKHGPTGWLIFRLQRFALLGWVLFFVLALVFVAFVFINTFKPVPVLAIDAQGRIIGEFDYMSAEERTDGELIAGAKQFLGNYLSANSKTVFKDYASALNMMSDNLKESKLEEIKKTEYLTKVDQAGSQSYLEYSKNAAVIWRRDKNSAVRLRGKLIIVLLDQQIERPFDITVELTSVPRNSFSTLGIVVNNVKNH